jgi:hypothetical protein
MGMTRKEIVQTIIDIGGAKYKSVENHYDYLIRSGRLPKLKNKGKTVKAARATTEKRSQICVEGQLRHFNVVGSIWDEQRVFNTPVVDKQSFSFVASHFFGNLDETCIVFSDGSLRIVASKDRKIVYKNLDEARLSITIVRVGTAADTDGPRRRDHSQ